MSQFDFGDLSSPLSGTAFIDNNLEPWRDALNSLHSGDTRPSYATAGTMWIDNTTNPWVLNVFDGTDDVSLGSINTSSNVFTPSGSALLSGDNTFTGDNIFQGVVDVTNVNAEGSGGGNLRTNGGTNCLSWGSGGSANLTAGGNLSMGTTHKIVNCADPTSAQDVATKAYVDGNTQSLLHIQDQKTAGTDGGSFSSGAWRTRDLNTEMTDEIGSTLTSNQFTLPAGTYYIEARAPGHGVGYHKAKLRNITDSSDVLIGSTVRSRLASESGSTVTNDSVITGRFTIADTKTFEIQHICSDTYAEGFGRGNNFSVIEVYTDVRVWKVS